MTPSEIAERQVVYWYLIQQSGHPRRSLLRPEHFQHEQHRIWWTKALAAESGWTWTEIGIPAEYVSALVDLPTVFRSQLQSVEASILDRSRNRSLQLRVGRALEDAKDGKLLGPDDLTARLREAISEAQAGSVPMTVSLRDAGMELVERWVSALGEKRGQGLTIPMPLARLQEDLGGWLNGTLWYVLGINSGHKTTLATQSAERVAKWLAETGQRGHTLVWPMEDTSHQNAARYLARNVRGADTRVFLRGKMPDEGPIGIAALAQEAGAALEQDWTTKVKIVPEQRPRLSRVLGVLESAVARGCRFAVLDCFQLIRKDSPKVFQLDHVEQVAYDLHGAAADLGIPILCTVQTTAEAKRFQLQEGKRLSLGDLRGGSAIGDSAFGALIVNAGGWFVERKEGQTIKHVRPPPRVRTEWERDKGWVHIHTAKIKDGPESTGRFRVDPAHDLITDEEP